MRTSLEALMTLKSGLEKEKQDIQKLQQHWTYWWSSAFNTKFYKHTEAAFKAVDVRIKNLDKALDAARSEVVGSLKEGLKGDKPQHKEAVAEAMKKAGEIYDKALEEDKVAIKSPRPT